MSSTSEFEIGATLRGKYRVGRQLGNGGMSFVIEATHPISSGRLPAAMAAVIREGSMSARAAAPRSAKTLSTSLAMIILAAGAALMTAHCDAYDCTAQSCDNGGSWKRCIVCDATSCTYEARNEAGDVVDTCGYDTSDTNARNACFGRTNASGTASCTGKTATSTGTGSAPTNDCAKNADCSLCVFDGCLWCDATRTCGSYGGSGCAGGAIDNTANCKAPPPVDDCPTNHDCNLCVFDACVWCPSSSSCMSVNKNTCQGGAINDTAKCQ